jgi:hypothetical protein
MRKLEAMLRRKASFVVDFNLVFVERLLLWIVEMSFGDCNRLTVSGWSFNFDQFHQWFS